MSTQRVRLDDIDSLIVEGLQDYVNVTNAALKDEKEQGKFILGGKLQATPHKGDASKFEETLSLGMAMLNEMGEENLAAPIPDSPINRAMHARLVDHFMGRSDHGLRLCKVENREQDIDVCHSQRRCRSPQASC